MPFTLAAPHSEVEPSRPQEIQRASFINSNAVSDTVTTTNHHPQRQRSACSLLMYTLKTNSMVRYGVLIFIIALISILYFATTHQVLKPTGAGPTILCELLNFNPKNVPDIIQKSPDDGFPTSIGGTQLFDTYEAGGKGNVQQKVEGTLTNNTGQSIRGILYDRGDGCQSINLNEQNEPPPLGITPSIPVPAVLLPFKIGLITSGTSPANPNCTLDTKIKNSIADKDTALIITLQSNTDEALNLRQNDYEITIFTINKLAGNGLLDKLGDLHRKYLSNKDGITTVLTVTLSPYRQLVVSSWLFAMFAVGGILVASFFVSIIIHMRLYRLRRNQQDEVRRQRAVDEELGMKKWTLEKEVIDTFPIIAYVKKSATISNNIVESTNNVAKSSTSYSDEQNENDEQNKNDESTSKNRQLHRSGSTRSTKSTRSLNAINNATNLYNSIITPTTPVTSNTPMTPTSPTSPTSPTVSTTSTTLINSTTPTASATAVTDDNDVDTCAICIEDFEEGEQLRLLPCKHWYHVECIDPWLTTKSSSCPLCKTDCRPNQIEEMVLDSRPNQDNNIESEGNERNNNNVVGRMSKAVGKLFGSIGRRSTSVRPVNTQQPQQPQPQQLQQSQQSRNNNDSTVVELEMENINSLS